MRLSITTLVAPIITAIIYGANAEPAGGGGELYPPGYLPLVNRANALLTAGQFNDAAKAYTEAIGELYDEGLSEGFRLTWFE